MDLFTPVIPKESWHPYFKNIQEKPNGFTCDVLVDWAKGFVDRDNKFVKEFQGTFNSSFWELYLFALFKSMSFNIDFSEDRPDFVITAPIPFLTEATVALNAQNKPPEHLRINFPPPDDLNKFNNDQIIRVANSIHSKIKKYRESYNKLKHVKNLPFVIAINTFDQPYSFLGSFRAVEAFLYEYYVNEEAYIKHGGVLEGVNLSKVYKDNNSSVKLGIFSDPSYSEVSAIIFNSCATMGKVRALSKDPNPNITFQAARFNPGAHKPYLINAKKNDYNETLIDGLRVYHNPYAIHPLDPDVFRKDDVVQISGCHENRLFGEQPEGHLLFRNVTTEE